MLDKLIDFSLLTLYDQEIKKYLKYVLPEASSDNLGGVKIGKNIVLDKDGTISVRDASETQPGVVQLNDTVTSESASQAATAKAVKTAYDKADAALPKAGGTMTGALTLAMDPSSALHAATKQYVDTEISVKLKALDAMTFRGTLGTNGTITALPTTGIVRGETYKVITSGSYAGYTCKVGDLLIAMDNGSLEANITNWVLIPSGDEKETTIRVSTTGVNVDTSAMVGDVILGMAAQKQVDSSIAVGSTSTNLPTVEAVANYVASAEYQRTIKYLSNIITLDGGTVSTILQSNGTSQQRIQLLDDETAGDTVFSFAQSTDTGDTWTSLLEIRDDGNIVANKFTGTLVGNADTATTASKVATTLIIQKNGITVAAFNGSAITTANIAVPTVYTGTLTPPNTLGNNGDIYVMT